MEKEKFKQIAKKAINAKNDLLDFWRNIKSSGISEEFDSDDIEILKELIISRIDISNSFELLCRIDRHEGVSVLFRRYLGREVDPDRKFGGYQFELSLMLSDIVEIYGRNELARIFCSPEMDSTKFNDHRVLDSIVESLDLQSKQEAVSWLREIGAEPIDSSDAPSSHT